MALKGTAVIELTNVKTGEKERYEEHNLITKALEYLHQPIGGLKSPLHATTTQSITWSNLQREPAYKYLLGGIALWDKTIPEDASIVAQPLGTRMVGCASYDRVNTTTSPCRGGFNATESYLTKSSVETSMKFVYDFTTSQANGIINCISLTHWLAGWNGFGGNELANDFSDYFDDIDVYNGIRQMVPYNFHYSETPAGQLIYIDPAEDVFYEVVSVSSTAVTIAKCRANIHQRSMFRNVYTEHPTLETITVALPTSMSSVDRYCTFCDIDHDRCYIVATPNSSVAASGTFYVIEISLTDYSASVHTMRNPIGETMYFDWNRLLCHNGYLYYFYSDKTSVPKISLADSSYSQLNIPTGYVGSGYPMVANGMIYFIGGYRQGTSTSTYGICCCLDPSTDEIRAMGRQNNIHDFNKYGQTMTPIKGYPLLYYYSDYENSGGTKYYHGNIWHNTNYLATINNLARPIEKTSDKTMKITYTIQEM